MYVDALGKTTTYQAYLSSLFPDISFTVETKADHKFKIVGAASVAAKVTRDAWIEGWLYEESFAPDVEIASRFFHNPVPNTLTDADAQTIYKSEGKWSEETGSGYPSGKDCNAAWGERPAYGKQIRRPKRG